MKNSHKFRNIILLLIMVLSYKKINAQLPNNDATFTLVAIDDFTGTAINTASWTPNGAWLCSGDDGVFDPANITVGGGWCKLKVEDLRPVVITSCSPSYTANFRGAAMISTFKFKYGYYEISAKCPIGKGIGFAFWTYGDCASDNNYQEADIIEDAGIQSANGTTMGMNYHSGDTCKNKIQIPWPFPEAIIDSTKYEHKYALFREPDRVTWYYDDKPVYVHITNGINAEYFIFDISVESGSIGGPPYISATFPQYFELNYFKVWQLQPDCNTAVTFCSNFNAGTWNSSSKVKKSISIGGSGCSDNINTSSNVSFWATDYVLLDEGTTITDNSSGSFMAKVTACPN